MNRRAVITRIFLVALIVAGAMINPGPQQAQNGSCDPKPGCRAQTKFDIAFMLDRSGSMALRGQTWNIMVEGIVRALRDSTVIPRDGSIAVSVVVFDGAAVISVPLTDINSAADATSIAGKVELLRCKGDIQSQVFPCPAGETSWFAGILTTDVHVSQARAVNPKPGARRVFILVSDGQTSPGDLVEATQRAEQARVSANAVGVPLVFNAFMVGVDPLSSEFASNKAALDQIVTPLVINTPPGMTTVIDPGACNQDGATFAGDDCSRQAIELADSTRDILRIDVPTLSLQVSVEADTAPGAAPGNSGLSLRQAIEAANCNGGATTITFNASLRDETINLLAPLPALTAPDIVINGCDPADQQNCTPLITIDGGGQIADGITIRSNRDVVRGLKIINFTRAGIVIAPACPADNIARNLIELNTLENSPTGVLVSDDKTDPRDGFNERNTISRNRITRAAPPSDVPAPALIDLGGDGPTANDEGDEDEGPNTLLNFPDSISVVSSGSGTVTISGQVSGPAVAGATIELYAITSTHVVSGSVIVDGVSFLAQATAGSCAVAVAGQSCVFTATDVPASPTGNYTATVTDSLGNASEFMFRDDGKAPAGPDAVVTATVDFGSVTLNTEAQVRQVEIVNNGNAPLQVTECEVARCAANDQDNTARFMISGCPSPTTQINPGQRITITVLIVTNVCGPARACLLLTTNDPLHNPTSTTLTGQIVSNLAPAVALEGNAPSLVFGPVSARSQRRGINKVIRKQAFRTFTIENKGCNPFALGFSSIRRVTDVPACISVPNADDSRLWVVTLFKGGTETRIGIGEVQPAAVPIAAGETLTFRVRFNPAVPPVVNKTCNGQLIADEVLPDEVRSVVNITAIGGGVTNNLAVPLTGRVTNNARFINASDPSAAPVLTFCRSGDDFLVQFSAYDPNQNLDRATYQFMDGAGRVVQVIDVTGIDQAIAARNLAVGQSFTIVQRFTGAADNNDVVSVQVRIFDQDGAQDARTVGPVSGNCGGISSQQFESSRNVVLLPDATVKREAVGRPSKAQRQAANEL